MTKRLLCLRGSMGFRQPGRGTRSIVWPKKKKRGRRHGPHGTSAVTGASLVHPYSMNRQAGRVPRQFRIGSYSDNGSKSKANESKAKKAEQKSCLACMLGLGVIRPLTDYIISSSPQINLFAPQPLRILMTSTFRIPHDPKSDRHSASSLLENVTSSASKKDMHGRFF